MLVLGRPLARRVLPNQHGSLEIHHLVLQLVILAEEWFKGVETGGKQ